VRQQDAYRQKRVQHAAPFSRATSPLLIVWLYLAFSKLLILTAASNTGVYEKLAIIDKYLVDHCWMLTRDHHLDDRLSLSHVSRRRPRIGAINDVHSLMARPRMSASHRSYVEDKLSKHHFAPSPILSICLLCAMPFQAGPGFQWRQSSLS